MKTKFSKNLETISQLIPLGVFQRIVHREVIDFFWHAVSNEPMPHVRHLYPVVPTSEFESALLYLKDNYTFIGYPDLHAYISNGKKLPKNAIHISFDDGYAECFNFVRPILLKHGIPCTFFLTTDLIDNEILFYRNKQSICIERLNENGINFQSLISKLRNSSSTKPPSTLPEFISWFKDLRLPDEPLIDEICRTIDVDWEVFLAEKQPYLTKGQVQQMHTDGFTIGAHTLTHRKLIDLSKSEIEREIFESCRFVGEITGQDIVPFSFPHSGWGLDRDHLAMIRNKYSMVGILFDTKGLRKDVSFIHNRIWAERPLSVHSQKGQGAEGIKAHILLAYQEVWVEETLDKGRKLRL